MRHLILYIQNVNFAHSECGEGTFGQNCMTPCHCLNEFCVSGKIFEIRLTTNVLNEKYSTPPKSFKRKCMTPAYSKCACKL